MDSKEINERIKAEAIRQHTISVDPNATKTESTTINMTDGVLIPKKGEKHVFTSWRLTFFGALILSAVLIIFFPDPYRLIFLTCLRGAPVTFEVTIFSIIGAVIIGTFTGLGSVSKRRWINMICGVYVELIRGIPLLVQLIFIYYAVGSLFHVEGMIAAIFSLSVCFGAYMGEIVRAGIIGRIRRETASELGLSPDVSIASGGGDNMMSAVGTGAVEDGIVTMSLGTSGTLFSSSSHAFHDPKLRLASFCSSTETWLPLLCTMNCTVASETLRKLFGQDVKAFDAAAERSGAGAGGLIMLPFFNGERVPDYPHGEGVLLGMRQSNVTEENIARATLEGVTYEFLLGLDAFRENGIDVSFLTLTGGGSKSRVWRQLVADMTGCPVRVPVIREAAAFGAALHGIWCLLGGRIEDVAKEHIAYDESASAAPSGKDAEVYRECYRKWLCYSDSLAPVFR